MPASEVVRAAEALSDPARVRAIAALDGRELCLCQLIDLLALAPSTVSRHMDVLHRAGLIERRKRGKWAYFRLAAKAASPVARRALRWVLDASRDDSSLEADRQRLECICVLDLKQVSQCYRAVSSGTPG